MSWSWIFAFFVLLWAVSFWKVLNSSLSESGENTKKKKVLLVIAHPDDESIENSLLQQGYLLSHTAWSNCWSVADARLQTRMAYKPFINEVIWFFSPTIHFLTAQSHTLHILCMSTGNAEGKGNLRKQELYEASAALGIISRQVEVIDHPEIQDGFNEKWNYDLLASIIGEKVRVLEIDMIVSFDDFGISGHPNHRDVSRGVRKYLRENENRDEAWELVSKGILRKYIGPIDFWFSLFFSLLPHPGQTLRLLPNASPHLTYLAMAQHKTQWLWYRKLFVLFSSFSYTNTLRKVDRQS